MLIAEILSGLIVHLLIGVVVTSWLIRKYDYPSDDFACIFTCALWPIFLGLRFIVVPIANLIRYLARK